MDLLSLPNELIACILRRSDFHCLCTLRCLNVKMNRIIVYLRLHRKETETLSFRSESDEIIVTTSENSKHFCSKDNTEEAIIGKCLAQVRGFQSLCLDGIKITDQVCLRLSKNKQFKKCLGKLSFNCCEFDVSEISLAKAFSDLTISLLVTDCTFKQTSFGNKVFDNLRLIEIEMRCQRGEGLLPPDLSAVTDDALPNIFKHYPELINLDQCVTGFTWCKLLENIQKYYDTHNIVVWDFGILYRRAVTNEAIRNALCPMGIVVNHYTIEGMTVFSMRGKYGSKNFITFTLK